MSWQPFVNETPPLMKFPATGEAFSKAIPADAKFEPAHSMSSYLVSSVPVNMSAIAKGQR